MPWNRPTRLLEPEPILAGLGGALPESKLEIKVRNLVQHSSLDAATHVIIPAVCNRLK